MSEYLGSGRRSSGRPAGPVKPDEPARSYAIALRAWTESAEMTRARLAEASRYSEATISHTLSGTRFPGLTEALLRRALTILELCNATPSDREAWERFHAALGAWARRGCLGSPPDPPRPPGVVEAGRLPQLPDTVTALLAQQREDGDSAPYLLPEGRLPRLSEVYVRQLLDQEGGEGQAGTAARPAHEVVYDGPGHLLVVAGPGGGKSTLVRQLAGGIADSWLDSDSPPPIVPLWVTATELVLRPETLEAALIPAALPEGVRWLALVDGLDEIVDNTVRRALVLRLARFAERHSSTHQMLIATRPLPSDENHTLQSAGLTPYALEPFDRPRLIAFAQRWFSDPEIASEYVRQIDLAGLAPLVRVPLLATITAVVYEAYPDSPLPGNQYLLYEQYRRHLARMKETQLRGRWKRLEDAVRDEAPGALGVIRELVAQRGMELLHHLAVEQTTRGAENLTQIALRWLDVRLDIPASRVIIGWQDHVRGALAGTGILVRTKADVRFLHTSFAEHLAAEFHAKLLPDGPSFSEPSWRAVLDRARAHDSSSLATLIHAAHRSTATAEALLKELEAGTDADRLVAAHLLAEGPIRDDTHARWFLRQLDATDPDLDPDWWRLAARIGHREITDRLMGLSRQPGERRYAAAAALAAHRPEAAGAELLSMVQTSHEPWATRCDAVRTLARLGDRRAGEAAQLLKEQLLERPRDPLNRESAVGVLKEVYSIDELDHCFRARLHDADGKIDFVALLALAALSDYHAGEVKGLLVSMIRPTGIAVENDPVVETLLELSGSMGSAAFCDLLTSASLGIQETLRLVSRGIAAGLDQSQLLNALLVTASSRSWRGEYSDDCEVFGIARSFSVLMIQLHEDVSTELIDLLHEVVLLPGREIPAGRSALLGLLVVGWGLMDTYDWKEPWDRSNGLEIVEILLADTEHALPPWWYGGPTAIWLEARTRPSTPLGDWHGRHRTWARMISGLVNDASEGDLWGLALVDTLAAFIADNRVPESGRAAVLLTLVLLLCTSSGRMDRAQRAAQLRTVGMNFSQRPALSRRLMEIAATIQDQ